MSVKKAMVIGAGQMGGGIAQVMAAAGIETYLNDINLAIVYSLSKNFSAKMWQRGKLQKSRKTKHSLY